MEQGAGATWCVAAGRVVGEGGVQRKGATCCVATGERRFLACDNQACLGGGAQEGGRKGAGLSAGAKGQREMMQEEHQDVYNGDGWEWGSGLSGYV